MVFFVFYFLFFLLKKFYSFGNFPVYLVFFSSKKKTDALAECDVKSNETPISPPVEKEFKKQEVLFNYFLLLLNIHFNVLNFDFRSQRKSG